MVWNNIYYLKSLAVSGLSQVLVGLTQLKMDGNMWIFFFIVQGIRNGRISTFFILILCAVSLWHDASLLVRFLVSHSILSWDICRLWVINVPSCTVQYFLDEWDSTSCWVLDFPVVSDAPITKTAKSRYYKGINFRWKIVILTTGVISERPFGSALVFHQLIFVPAEAEKPVHYHAFASYGRYKHLWTLETYNLFKTNTTQSHFQLILQIL